jgi:hypothetical protein
MVKVSLKNIKELFLLIKKRSLKEILFGKKVRYNSKEREWFNLVKSGKVKFKSGNFVKRDILHKGKGKVYLFALKDKNILLFDSNVKIQSGPDLYVYLSTKKDSIGKIINLGLIKGTKGGQSYIVKEKDLEKYKSVIIHCKKFDVMFTYATLK